MTGPPIDTKVQMNLLIPWDFKEFLRNKALTQNKSLNAFVIDALMDVHGSEFTRDLT